MSLYGTPQVGGVLTALSPGDSMKLFDAETPAAPASSIAFRRAYSQAADGGVTFTISFAAAPTSVLVIQGSNTDVDAEYQTLYTSTDKQLDNYTDTTLFAFYRARLVSQSAGGAVTVIAQR